MANLNPKRYVDRTFSIPFYDVIGANTKLKLLVSFKKNFPPPQMSRQSSQL